MRSYFKKSGLTFVIVVAIIAMGVLPKPISQWVMLGALIIWTGVNGVILCLNHRNVLKTAIFKRKNSLKNTEQPEEDDLLIRTRYAVMLQLAHRITDKLKSVYPNASWSWADKPDNEFFIKGGRERVVTQDTGEFSEADIIIDSFGRIDVQLLKINDISDALKNVTDNEEQASKSDVSAWYEHSAKELLKNLITELNAKGETHIEISEDGSIKTKNNESVGVLNGFPAKILWEQLRNILTDDGLIVSEKNGKLILGW